ncbi:hypothetical protein F4Y93_08780 [Candidatus Poribacteria bacterium]|nr:hypothetical protein [Candidatus Poribacteria bacterium]
MANTCKYKGQDYSNGAVVCMNGWEYQCNNGRWISLGSSCRGEDGAQHVWSEGDESLTGDTATTSKEEMVEDSICECVSSSDTNLVRPDQSLCAGVWGFAVGWLTDDTRPVAIQKNWGSSQRSFDMLKRCYGERAKSATYYHGRKVIVCAPCITCAVGMTNC